MMEIHVPIYPPQSVNQWKKRKENERSTAAGYLSIPARLLMATSFGKLKSTRAKEKDSISLFLIAVKWVTRRATAPKKPTNCDVINEPQYCKIYRDNVSNIDSSHIPPSTTRWTTFNSDLLHNLIKLTRWFLRQCEWCQLNYHLPFLMYIICTT